jgi:hypothetical protein
MRPVRKLTRYPVVLGCAVIMLGVLLLTAGCDKLTGGDKPAAEKAATENAPDRVPFADLFDVNGTTVTPKRVMRVGSVTMTPEVPFDSQVMRIDGKPFSEFIGRDAEVTKKGDISEVRFP